MKTFEVSYRLIGNTEYESGTPHVCGADEAEALEVFKDYLADDKLTMEDIDSYEMEWVYDEDDFDEYGVDYDYPGKEDVKIEVGIFDQYGEQLCTLDYGEFGFVIPEGIDILPCHFNIGDKFIVRRV